MKIKLLLNSLLLLVSLNCFSQFSKTHYIPPMSVSSGLTIGSKYIYISTPSTTPVNFIIKQIGGTSINGTVSRDIPFIFNVDTDGNPDQLFVDFSQINSVRSNKGYIVEAGDLVYVSVRIISGDDLQNQAGEVVSKGLAALGTSFRIGGYINNLTTSYGNIHHTFVSILATENNTTVSFDDIKLGVVLINNATAGNTPSSITLNSGQSFIMAVQGPTVANKDGLIGSSVTSDKPIAVTCGSIAGTNGEMNNIDFGFDQIVSAERTGKDYIFVKSTGLDNVERALLVANEDNTEIFLNGNTVANYTINAGDYVALTGADFNAFGNLFVHTSKNIFAYQSVGDNFLTSQANQELFFVPPLSCQTPKTIDNIPFIDLIGSKPFTGRVTITTKVGSPLNFIIDTIPYTLASLPVGINVVGPTAVTGNTDYECYTLTGISGNVSVYSTTELYLAAYGSSGAATFGGYYSGFTFKPEITYQPINATASNCIPNVNLQVSSLSGFNSFQWYFNDVAIPGATNSTYNPTQPGYYFVSATISACGVSTVLISDKIPVSNCASNTDNDTANDNVDLDYDNDGIANCTESYGNQPIDISNLYAGNLNVNNGDYINTFVGNVTTSATASPTPFTGNANGNIISQVPAGITNFAKYEMSFGQPISLAMEYVLSANATDLLNSDAQFVINSPIDKTVTVLNPTNQLLIDTNYDGIYESGITEFSSFEIRFRLNSTIPLAAGTGTFKFVTHQATTISFTHKNLSDTTISSATFKFYAVCVPKDSDNDGVSDDMDFDSDNDGIPDRIEAQGTNLITLSNVDADANGLDDAYGLGIIPANNDTDSYPNYLDLDSDNDGIQDIIEAGSVGNSTNTSGISLGPNFGTNGLDDLLETFPDSGILNFTIVDTDSDGTLNYLDIDSDNDNCNDIIEAGYSDANGDMIVGDENPPVFDSYGLVISASGYGVPNSNYITAAPIVITTQPINKSVCEAQASTTFSIVATSITSYQWQVSTDGINWTNITNNTTYSNATTDNLTINNAGLPMNNYRYRVFLNRNGNTCGLYSSEAILTILALPVVTSPITLVQCDNDTDGISSFNLTQKNNVISSNFAAETFTYYTNSVAATTQDATFLISNPTAFTTSNTTVFARVQNTNGCFRIAQINLLVSVTQIPASVVIADIVKCDDYLDAVNDDHDGIASFDLSPVSVQILTSLPATSGPYTLSFYKNEVDFLAETDTSGNSLAIPPAQLTSYRNIAYPNQQEIWARVESTSTNDCYGFRKFKLIVEALPIINSVGINNIIRHCDDNQDGTYIFDTSAIESTILGTQTNKTITYFDENGNPIPTPFPSTYSVTTSQTITVKIQNNATVAADAPCKEEGSFQFIVDDLPEAFALSTTQINSLISCDDEADPLLQDGSISFDTTGIEATIVGSQTGFLIKYIYENGTSSTTLNNPFVTETQDIIVRISNPINPDCYAETLLNFIVRPLPKIDLNTDGDDNVIVCANLPGNIITLRADLTDSTPTNNYTYQWYINSVAIPGATQYTLNINTPGTYTVAVTNGFGCSRTRTIEAIPSDIAEIETIQINDLTDDNSVLINVVSGTGGNYVYSIDAESGPFQESNLFTNLTYGFHIVYIKDLNGCGTTKKIISVLGVPKYFTPNGDGVHDSWNIRGVSKDFYPNTIIYIYDRYGKLIAQISPLGAGWDGTYNGNLALSDDYWYYIKIDDGRVAKGHFSLKR